MFKKKKKKKSQEIGKGWSYRKGRMTLPEALIGLEV